MRAKASTLGVMPPFLQRLIWRPSPPTCSAESASERPAIQHTVAAFPSGSSKPPSTRLLAVFPYQGHGLVAFDEKDKNENTNRND